MGSWLTRRVQLPGHPNIITYRGSQNRGAPLTLESKGGQAIAERLGL
jgi:hypothetical protein